MSSRLLRREGGQLDHHTIAITWNYGVHATIGFDPSHQMLDFAWITGEYFTVTEHDGSVMISLPGNQQSYMLDGVSLSEMSIDNIMANDPSTLDVWTAALAGTGTPEEPGDGHHDVVTITWDYGTHATIDFDPSHQVLDFGWVLGEYFTVTEHDGSVMISLPGNQQSYMLDGVSLSELSMDNIMANDQSALDVWAAALDGAGEPDDPGHGSEHIFTLAWIYGVHAEIDFDPSHQMLDFGWITGEYFTFSEVNGSVVISLPLGMQSFTLTGVTLSEMSIANIMANDPSTFDVWADVLDEPSQPEDPELPEGGTIFAMSTYGADIVGFDPATDKLDLGENSVHAFVVVDTPEGMGFLNPWNDSIQIVQGINLADLDVGNFLAVSNNHLREDLSGALAWEKGIVEQPNTVYARSHEYCQVDRVAFNPATDVVDFRYYGSRENLSMIQSEEGVVIANGGTGQKLILLGTTLDQLSGENFIFHYAQVYEDVLDEHLGITFVPENVLSRSHIPDAGAGTAMGADDGQPGDDLGTITKIAWNWGTTTTLAFDPADDIIDFATFLPSQFTVQEQAGSVVISITGHQQSYVLQDIDLDELSIGNIMARDSATLSAWAGYLA